MENVFAMSEIEEIEFITALEDWVDAAPAGEKNGREEAMRRILEAANKGARDLSLNKLGLSSLPNQI